MGKEDLRALRLNISRDTTGGGARTTALARRRGVGSGWVGRVEPKHVGVVLVAKRISTKTLSTAKKIK